LGFKDLERIDPKGSSAQVELVDTNTVEDLELFANIVQRLFSLFQGLLVYGWTKMGPKELYDGVDEEDSLVVGVREPGRGVCEEALLEKVDGLASSLWEWDVVVVISCSIALEGELVWFGLDELAKDEISGLGGELG
jgi:hypothetical protein